MIHWCVQGVCGHVKALRDHLGSVGEKPPDPQNLNNPWQKQSNPDYNRLKQGQWRRHWKHRRYFTHRCSGADVTWTDPRPPAGGAASPRSPRHPAQQPPSASPAGAAGDGRACGGLSVHNRRRHGNITHISPYKNIIKATLPRCSREPQTAHGSAFFLTLTAEPEGRHQHQAATTTTNTRHCTRDPSRTITLIRHRVRFSNTEALFTDKYVRFLIWRPNNLEKHRCGGVDIREIKAVLKRKILHLFFLLKEPLICQVALSPSQHIQI